MASRIIISIVSHGNQNMILESGLVSSLQGFDITLRENVPTAKQLFGGSEETAFVQNLRIAGFGANHNRNFELANPRDDDWFVICNPDIAAKAADVTQLLDLAEKDGASIAAPVLWNNATNRYDDNVRPFPTISSLLFSFVGFAAPSRYGDGTLSGLKNPDWASGAFLAFKAITFRKLCGFDERYFMYMEDVDICRRALDQGCRIHFYPQVKLIHNAARHNRRIFSSNFRYHLISVIKYFLTRGSSW